MSNLPIDANDEDRIQRGLNRPSLEDYARSLNDEFRAVNAQYDNGGNSLSSDNIFPPITARDIAGLTTEQRRKLLTQRGLIPPDAALPNDEYRTPESYGLTDSPENFVRRWFPDDNPDSRDPRGQDQRNTPSSQTDSYGQPTTGATTAPTPLTAQVNSSQQAPGASSSNSQSAVYNYTPMKLYDDRYDFNTGKIMRSGVATGARGGSNGFEDAPNTLGALGLSSIQQEITSEQERYDQIMAQVWAVSQEIGQTVNENTFKLDFAEGITTGINALGNKFAEVSGVRISQNQNVTRYLETLLREARMLKERYNLEPTGLFEPVASAGSQDDDPDNW